MPAARVAAFAKLNLTLRVLAREASGYHQLETLFCRIDLADDVVVRRTHDGSRSLDVAGADLGPVERNLAWRAALAYCDLLDDRDGFAIEITKRIPVGGGLGGGSADAGAVLRAFDALTAIPILEQRLLPLAATLGADVAYLTTEAPLALAWGRGEQMLELPPLPAREVVLVLPPFPIATADAYGWLAGSRAANPQAAPGATLHTRRAFGTWLEVVRESTNDFEQPVFDQRPELGAIFARLADAPGVALARMSGSGSTLFALGHQRIDPDAIAASTGCRVLPSRTLDAVAPVVYEE